MKLIIYFVKLNTLYNLYIFVIYSLKNKKEII